MPKYRVRLSDGSSRELYFGHEPTKDEVQAAISAPTIGPGTQAGPSDAEVAAQSASESQAIQAAHPEPNGPGVLARGVAFAAAPSLIAAAPLGAVARVASNPLVVGGTSAASDIAEGKDPQTAAFHGIRDAGATYLGGKALPYILPFVPRGIVSRVASALGRIAPEAVAATEAGPGVATSSKAAIEEAHAAVRAAMAKSAPAPVLADTINAVQSAPQTAEVAPIVAKAAKAVSRAKKVKDEAAPLTATLEESLQASLAGPKYGSDEYRILKELQMQAQASEKGKAAVKEAVQQIFPDDWQEKWKMIMAPMTRMR